MAVARSSTRRRSSILNNEMGYTQPQGRRQQRGKNTRNHTDKEEDSSSLSSSEDFHDIHAEPQEMENNKDKDEDIHQLKTSRHEIEADEVKPMRLPQEARPTKRIKLVYRSDRQDRDHTTKAASAKESFNLDTNIRSRRRSNKKNQPTSTTIQLSSLRHKNEMLHSHNAQYIKENAQLKTANAELQCKLQDLFFKQHNEREKLKHQGKILKMGKKLLWECGIEWARREQLWGIERQTLMNKVHGLTAMIMSKANTGSANHRQQRPRHTSSSS